MSFPPRQRANLVQHVRNRPLHPPLYQACPSTIQTQINTVFKNTAFRPLLISHPRPSLSSHLFFSDISSGLPAANCLRLEAWLLNFLRQSCDVWRFGCSQRCHQVYVEVLQLHVRSLLRTFLVLGITERKGTAKQLHSQIPSPVRPDAPLPCTNCRRHLLDPEMKICSRHEGNWKSLDKLRQVVCKFAANCPHLAIQKRGDPDQ